MGKPRAIVDEKKCLACGGCVAICPKDAIKMSGEMVTISVDECTGCGLCIKYCAFGAIRSEEKA